MEPPQYSLEFAFEERHSRGCKDLATKDYLLFPVPGRPGIVSGNPEIARSQHCSSGLRCRDDPLRFS